MMEFNKVLNGIVKYIDKECKCPIINNVSLFDEAITNLDGIESIHVLDILKLLNNNIKGKKYIIGNKFTIEIVKKNTAIIY